ncbi:hypothetical protein SNE40_010341 [Patella caerulea]|uniref:Wnt inhibitory factor 1 n=2 Tax=Patella caerulea TaxID=87958 RepID=A0AAN8JU21_PATCE
MAAHIRMFLQLILCMQFIYVTKSCILLLNGWDPLSIYERTEMADVVVGANVLRAFKTDRTEAGTYTAEVKVLDVYKGDELMRNISTSEYKVYNVSNFGDKTMCYADLTEGAKYILFLTIYNGRMSAKYDDIFGAASDFSTDNEQQVLEYLGWFQWSDWSSCTTKCNSGHQTRTRTCSRENVTDCEGQAFESRECNTFSCEDQKDLLSYLGVPKLPLGVSQNVQRPTAYIITPRAKLFLPVATLYDVTLPRDFAIILTIKLQSGFNGYLLSVSDIQGRQRVGLFFGDEEIRMDYLDDNYFGVAMPTFDVNVTDGQWHQLALSLSGNDVTLYQDCAIVLKKRLERSRVSSFGSNLMLSVGPYFPRYGNPFSGELEQLVISEKPQTAKYQCSVQTGHRIEPINDGSLVVKPVTMTTTESLPSTTTQVFSSDWSEWSSCSTTCGRGSQSRTMYCSNNVLSLESCLPYSSTPVQTRICYLQHCKEPCPAPCLNGGVCETNGRCRCSLGYQGDHCQDAICHQACQNNGVCIAPNQCACPNGYTGNTCNQPVCGHGCKNGGKCVAPGKCECLSGFSGPECKPFCFQICHNGGVCTRHNVCRCPKGYSGHDCSIPVCSLGCFNGGKCVAPEKCSCPRGYRGQYCHKAKCRPKCQNKGKCVAPDTCMCRRGYFGARCEQFKCTKQCKNGGKCIGPNKCECPPSFHGRRCHKEKCSMKCLNGGRCRRNNKCKCKKGFAGKTCEIRNCKYEQYTIPYKRSYRRVVREEFVTKCGPWKWKRCVQTRMKYVTVAKETFRTAYRCV